MLTLRTLCLTGWITRILALALVWHARLPHQVYRAATTLPFADSAAGEVHLQRVVSDAGGWLRPDLVPPDATLAASWPDGRRLVATITHLPMPAHFRVRCESKQPDAQAFCDDIAQRYHAPVPEPPPIRTLTPGQKGKTR
jgi:hypothetical protein